MAAVGIFQHLRNYASAGVFSAIVGLISFPILTRSLSVSEYGVVGLITSSLTLCIAIGKLGMQHAVIRFFSQIKHGNSDFTVGQMNSTISMVFFSFASSSTVLWLICGFLVLPAVLQYENIPSLFLLASGIVFIRLLGSGIMNILRAQQRSAEVAISQSIARFLNLVLIVLLLLASDLKPWTVIACLLVAEVVAVLYAAWQYWPEFQFRLKDVSLKLAKAMLVYGLPLMMLESLSLVLRLSDRYLIEAMLGVNSLGQYSASYNLASYIEVVILASLIQAVRPAYLHMWESQGKPQAQKFLSDGFRMYMVVGIPFVVMFSITSPYLLGLLAGEKYSPGTVVIPYVAASFWLQGAMLYLGAGLYIFKNTRLLMLWSLVATVINLVLNLLLIPRYGITGAAAVTIVSYVIFMLGVASCAFRYVVFPVELKTPAIMLLASVLVFFLLRIVDFHSDLGNFIGKGLIGSSVLLVLMWLLDPGIRQWSNEKLFSRANRV